MVSEFVQDTVTQSPLWLVGWNCFSFANDCMRYHSHSSIKNLFSVQRVGAFGKPSYDSIINIPGNHNVKVLVYVVKILYKMQTFKVGDLAKVMRVTRKMEMPPLNAEISDAELREDNTNDCVVVLDIWKKRDLSM